MFKLDPVIQQKLDALNSNYRITHQNHRPIAIIIDKTTKEAWARGEAETEPDAVARAIENATKTKKPQTIAETLVEKNSRIAELEAQLATAKTAPAKKIVPDGQGDAAIVDGTQSRSPETTPFKIALVGKKNK